MYLCLSNLESLVNLRWKWPSGVCDKHSAIYLRKNNPSLWGLLLIWWFQLFKFFCISYFILVIIWGLRLQVQPKIRMIVNGPHILDFLISGTVTSFLRKLFLLMSS